MVKYDRYTTVNQKRAESLLINGCYLEGSELAADGTKLYTFGVDWLLLKCLNQEIRVNGERN